MATTTDMECLDAITAGSSELQSQKMRMALADLVEMFHARPDILRLCGPAEVQCIKAACDALNGFLT